MTTRVMKTVGESYQIPVSVADAAAARDTLLGTSHRKPPVKNLVGSVARCWRYPSSKVVRP